jgi:hypothetical protein
MSALKRVGTLGGGGTPGDRGEGADEYRSERTSRT